MPAGFGPEENPEYYRPIVQVLSPPRSVRDVLTAEVHHAQRFLSKPVLLKYANLLDVATPASRRTCCFTKAYGHYLEGSGSVFAENPEAIETVFSSITESSTEEAKYEALASLRLRFFSPREVSRLMCFPEYHSFPDDVTEKQRYRLLGNSVNVFVVATLMKLLIQS
jgi:tRNA (cytosine38-C5)-methyltransferase